jgi:hypothetical protein
MGECEMAKLKVVARVTRRAKEQALKLGLTVCAAGRKQRVMLADLGRRKWKATTSST